MPSRSYTVGTMSTACTYWWRTSSLAAICAGHDTRSMSAVPPSSPAQRFQYGNGVSRAQAQPVL